jgi:hypothetical protein
LEIKLLNEEEVILALGLNTLCEELSHQLLLPGKTVTLLHNLLDLIKVNKKSSDIFQ